MADKLLIQGLRPNILIVDDTPGNLDVLTGILDGAGYDIRPVTNGRDALRSMRTYPPDLILLDIIMPDMDGFALFDAVRRDPALGGIPVIFISFLHETEDKLKAFTAGAVDYITKPFQNAEVLARVGTHLRLRSLQIEMDKHKQNLEHLVRMKIEEITESQMATIFALAKLAESRDDDTGRHLERIRYLCCLLTQGLARNENFRRAITPQFVKNIAHACPLHDIGKVGIPDRILLKPGPLSRDEYEEMKKHTVIGAETLTLVREQYSKNTFITMGIEIAGHHHERWDGKGYPDGLAGADIPLCARILSIVDSYDAMRSKRCYKEARPHDEALAEIIRGRGTQFDPGIADEFAALGDRIALDWDSLKG